MAIPLTEWQTFLKCPAFVINLDRRPERWKSTEAELKKAGFTDIRRVSAVDAVCHPENAERSYRVLGSPPRHPTFNRDFDIYPGTFGCFLSHLTLWKYIIDHEIPYAFVFEDDIEFHSEWMRLGPEYYRHMPPTEAYDILYLGSQFETHQRMPSAIDSVPVFCTHAYAMPLAGVRRLYKYILNTLPESQGGNGGIYTIDIMLIEAMKKKSLRPFRWLVWNSWFYSCQKRDKMSPVWHKRNGGLVFQAERFGTDIREYVS
jgi:GR25 family glycosyltransferase involved in LPS biosynthesis